MTCKLLPQVEASVFVCTQLKHYGVKYASLFHNTFTCRTFNLVLEVQSLDMSVKNGFIYFTHPVNRWMHG